MLPVRFAPPAAKYIKKLKDKKLKSLYQEAIVVVKLFCNTLFDKYLSVTSLHWCQVIIV